jgi:DNA-binding CsgD family transcriptional regulator
VQLGESSLAFAPLVQALRGVRRRLGGEEFAELLGPAGSSVGAMLGITEVGSDGPRGQVFEQLLGVLGRLGDRQPMLLVFEDLHWADASTRDLVAFLARNLRDLPVGLVLTYRGDELHRRHPLVPVLADLQRDPQVERITLTGLGRSDLAALLAQINAGDVALDELVQRTEGNPFYVEELVAASGLGERVPATLAEVILARVNDLPEPTPAVLHQAAVLGEGIDDQWLAELTGRPLAEITEALREAVSRHLLVADGAGCRFRHALVREALYDDLLPGERERLHAAAARLLQQRSLHMPEHVRQTLLAYHAHAAGDLPTAFAASVRAGSECEEVYALGDAAVQYERALALWDQVTDPDTAAGMSRSQLLLRVADLLSASSYSPRAITLAEAALAALPDDASPEQQVTILARIEIYGPGILRDRPDGSPRAACERAVALVADRPPSPEKALALSAYGHHLFLHARSREAEPVLREAISVAEQVGAISVHLDAVCRLAGALVDLGRPNEGIAVGECALQLAREHGTTEQVSRALQNLSDELYVSGRYEEAEAVAAEGVAYAIKTGHHGNRAVTCNANRIWAMYLAGRWREAERVEVRFNEQIRQVGGAAHAGWLLVLLGQGRVDEAKVIVEDQLEATAGFDDVQNRASTLMNAGELAELERRWDQARELLDRSLTLARGTEDQYYSSRGYASALRVERRRVESLAGQRTAAEEIERAGQVADQRIEEARDLAARLAANGIDLLPEPAAWLRTAEAEQAAIHAQDTAQTWADLADTWHAIGQPYPTAVAQYRHADALLRQHGNRDQARRSAAAALEVAEELGAAPLAGEIRQLAQRGRLDLTPPQPHPDTARDLLDITAREAEVLSLLSAGRTNREIARALYMSEKTASVHVSHLLRKLGATNRLEAAAIAQRLDLADTTAPRTGRTPAPKR